MLLTPAKCGQSKSTVSLQNTPQVCFPVLCRNTRPRVGRLQCRWDVLAWRTGCWTMSTSTSCCPGCDRVRATPHCLLQLHLLSGAALHCRPAPRLRHGALASPAMKLPCVLRPYCRRLPLFTGLAVLHCTGAALAPSLLVALLSLRTPSWTALCHQAASSHCTCSAQCTPEGSPSMGLAFLSALD